MNVATAFRAEFAVQAFDEGVVRGFAGSAEVEDHIVDKGPEVELGADELGTVIETNRLRISDLVRRLLEGGDDITTAVFRTESRRFPEGPRPHFPA